MRFTVSQSIVDTRGEKDLMRQFSLSRSLVICISSILLNDLQPCNDSKELHYNVVLCVVRDLLDISLQYLSNLLLQ